MIATGRGKGGKLGSTGGTLLTQHLLKQVRVCVRVGGGGGNVCVCVVCVCVACVRVLSRKHEMGACVCVFVWWGLSG